MIRVQEKTNERSSYLEHVLSFFLFTPICSGVRVITFFFCKLSWGPLIFVSVYFLLPCFVCLFVFLFVCKICYFCFSLVLLLFLPFFIVWIVLSVFLWNTTFNYLLISLNFPSILPSLIFHIIICSNIPAATSTCMEYIYIYISYNITDLVIPIRIVLIECCC